MVVVTPATIMVTRLSTAKFMIGILQQETKVWVPSSLNVIVVRVLIILQNIVRNKDLQKYGERNSLIQST